MPKRTRYFFALLLLIWFGASWLSAKFGVLNNDEAFYLTASHLVFHGLLPYRDFAFTQGPLLPYVYGLALWLVGPNLMIGRFVAVGFSTLAFALALNITHKLAGMRGALLAFLLLIATPDVLYFLGIVKTYSLVATLTLLALALVLHSSPSPPARWPFFSTLVAGMAAMTRITFLVVVVFVFLFWVSRKRWRASGLALVVLGFVMLLSASSSDGNLLFDVFEFHLERVHSGITLVSMTSLALIYGVVFAPALLLLVFLLMLWRVHAFRERLVLWWHTRTANKLLLFVIAVALWLVHVPMPTGFWDYQAPSYLLSAILLAAVAAQAADLATHRAWAGLLIVCLAGSSAGLWVYRLPTMWQSTNALVSANSAAQALARRAAPGNMLLGMFNHLALASGIKVYPGNEMGMFSVADASSPAETVGRHFLPREAVTEALDSCSATFVATDVINQAVVIFPVSVPSIQPIPNDTQNQWRNLLQEKYRTIYSDARVRIFERIPEKCMGITLSAGQDEKTGGM